MESEELKVVRAFIEAINRRDLAGLAALMTEDHVFVDSEGTVASGREALVPGWRQYFEMFPDYRVEVESTFQQGSRLAAFGSWTATYAGKDGPVPENAVGGPAAWQAVVEGGRIKFWQVYADHTRTWQVINRSK